MAKTKTIDQHAGKPPGTFRAFVTQAESEFDNENLTTWGPGTTEVGKDNVETKFDAQNENIQ